MLYAGWWLGSIGVTDQLGCDALWYASYTRRLDPRVYRAIGWDLERLALWQYDGSDDSNGQLPGYPVAAPIEHGEDVDISALVSSGGVPGLRALIQDRAAPSICATGSER